MDGLVDSREQNSIRYMTGQMLRLPDNFIHIFLQTFTNRLDLRAQKLPLSQALTLLHLLPQHQHISTLHLPCDKYSTKENSLILHALGRTLPACTRVRALGLHGLHLNLSQDHDNTRAFVQFCAAARRSLSGLALQGLNILLPDSDNKLTFFNALSSLHRLRVLALCTCDLLTTATKTELKLLHKLKHLTVLGRKNSPRSKMKVVHAVHPTWRFPNDSDPYQSGTSEPDVAEEFWSAQ